MEDDIMKTIIALVLLLGVVIGLVLPFNNSQGRDMYQQTFSNSSVTYLRDANVINASIWLVNASLNSTGQVDRLITGTDFSLLPMNSGNESAQKLILKGTSNNASTSCVAQACNISYSYYTNSYLNMPATGRTVTPMLYAVIFVFALWIIFANFKKQ